MTDWEDIARRHGPLVWRTVYRLLGNTGSGARAAAQDCFQETFLAALDYARRNQVVNWPGLLQRIATTRALDAIARRRDGAHRFRGGDALEAVPAAADAEPDAAAQAAETLEHFRSALAELPPGQREVFCLRHLEQMSYDEIAQATGMSADAVGVALHRARGRLRDALSGAIDPARAKPATQRDRAANPAPDVR